MQVVKARVEKAARAFDEISSRLKADSPALTGFAELFDRVVRRTRSQADEIERNMRQFQADSDPDDGDDEDDRRFEREIGRQLRNRVTPSKAVETALAIDTNTKNMMDEVENEVRTRGEIEAAQLLRQLGSCLKEEIDAWDGLLKRIAIAGNGFALILLDTRLEIYLDSN